MRINFPAWGTLLAVHVAVATAPAFAQSYPTKPVRIIVPLTAGSGVDIIGRLISQKLSELWGQQLVVDNRFGAGGTLGTAIVARAPADGYTLLVSGSSHTVNTALYVRLPYDTLRDFTNIASIAALYQVIVVAPSVGVKSVSELIALAKAKPGQVTYASPGVGTGVHLAGERFRIATGISVVHVPYKGGPEAMTDVMMARVDYWIPSIGTALPFIQSNKLLALGVSGRQRSGLLPEVPTIIEAGVPGYESSLWFGLWAPAGVASSTVGKIAGDVARVVASPDVREQLRKLGGEPLTMTPAEFARYVSDDIKSVARTAKAAGIKPQ
jgi:tripartite-type tricarboxylate transporter receptor subunit TctC